MKVELSTIFNNPYINTGIQETHQNIKEQHKGLTLGQCFMVGQNMKPEKVQQLRAQGVLDELFHFCVDVWEYENSKESLKDFAIYSTIEIQNAWIRARFLKRMMSIKKFSNIMHKNPKEVPLHLIEDFSEQGFEYSSVLMPVKGFLCAQGISDQFQGILPNTGPVQKASLILFGKDIKSNVKHTEMCAILSAQTGVSRVDINTALWFLGKT